MRPDLVAEITLQPVRRYGVDAAILFSDIVVPLKAVGVDLDIEPGVGPVRRRSRSATRADVDRAAPARGRTRSSRSPRRSRLLVAELGATPLIGFAGAPFTLASYLVEGGPSRRPRAHQGADVRRPGRSGTTCSTGWPDRRRRSCACRSRPGVGAVQLFDSWVGVAVARRLPRVRRCRTRPRCWPRSRDAGRAADPLRRRHRRAARRRWARPAPTWSASTSGCRWTRPRAGSGRTCALQGNLDPAVAVRARARCSRTGSAAVLDGARACPGHVFNLGHGVLPDTDPDVLARRGRPGARGAAVSGPAGGATATSWSSAAGSPAWRPRTPCSSARRRLDVTVLEGSPTVGGKLRADRGRRGPRRRRAPSRCWPADPEALGLAARGRARRRARAPGRDAEPRCGRGRACGRCRPVRLMGVPADLRALAASQVLSLAGLARVPLDHVLARTPVRGDVSVGGVRRAAARPGGGRPARRAAAGRGLRRARRRALAATRPCRSSPARSAVERSLLRAAPRSAESPRRPASPSCRCSPGCAAASAGCRQRWRGVPAAAGRTGRRDGPRAAALRRAGGGWSSGPARRRGRWTPTRWSLAVPAAPAARLLAGVGAGGAPPSWPRSSTPASALVTLAFPGRRGAAAADRHRVPRPAGRGQDGQGGDVLLAEVGVGRRRRRATWPCCGPRSAGTARSPTCSATTPSWSSWRSPTSSAARRTGCTPSTSTVHALGRRRCRSTPSGTSSGSRTDPAGRRRAARPGGVRGRVRRGRASRPASRRRRAAADRVIAGARGAGRMGPWLTTKRWRCGQDRRQAGPRPQRRDPLHDVVGVPGGATVGGRRPGAPLRRRGRGAVRRSSPPRTWSCAAATTSRGCGPTPT